MYSPRLAFASLLVHLVFLCGKANIPTSLSLSLSLSIYSALQPYMHRACIAVISLKTFFWHTKIEISRALLPPPRPRQSSTIESLRIFTGREHRIPSTMPLNKGSISQRFLIWASGRCSWDRAALVCQRWAVLRQVLRPPGQGSRAKTLQVPDRALSDGKPQK